MLNFYLLDDELPKPDDDAGLQFVDGLTLECWEWLQRHEIMDDAVPFFEDCRLMLSEVRSRRHDIAGKQKLLENVPGFQSEAVDCWQKILDLAIHHNCGLVGFCDPNTRHEC